MIKNPKKNENKKLVLNKKSIKLFEKVHLKMIEGGLIGTLMGLAAEKR